MRKRRLWTSEEDEVMRRDYKKKPTCVIAEELSRSVAGIHKRAQYLGLSNNYERWDDADIGLLIEYYHKLPKVEIAEMIGRSEQAVITMARQLKIPLNKQKEWTADDLNYMKNNYNKKSVPQIAQHLNRSITCVKSKARRMGLVKKRWRPTNDEYLRQFYSTIKTSLLSDQLECPEKIIHKRAKQLGLTPPGKYRRHTTTPNYMDLT